MAYSPSLVVASVTVIVILLLYKYIVHPVFFSPLRNIPNAHNTSAISPIWILWNRKRSRENEQVYAAHKRLGPVVRLAPSEISVNCVENGIRTVYAGGFEKHTWYSNVFSNYDGVRIMFSEPLNAPHSARKRMMSHIYSKSYLQNSPSVAAAASALIYRRILPKLDGYAVSSAAVDVYSLFNSITMDFITAYLFGLCNSSNFIENESDANWWLQIYEPRRKHVFWPQELPRLTNALNGIWPLTPKWVDDANRQIEDWCLKMCDSANAQLARSTQNAGPGEKLPERPENIPVVVQQLTNALTGGAEKSSEHLPGYNAPVRMKVASEMVDHLSAGEETSAITLTFLFYELAQRPDLQERLRDEAKTLSPQIATDHQSSDAITEKSLPPAKAISDLPLLHAILMETLRVHAPIPGPQPRVTPRNRKTMLGPYGNIPGDIRVSANAYCLHRNEKIFPDPEAWRPDRWLENDGLEAERSRWFWAFGSGGRMCIGSNFAMQSIKTVTAAVLGNFRVEMNETGHLEAGGGFKLEQEDAYTAHPVGHKLMLRFMRW